MQIHSASMRHYMLQQQHAAVVSCREQKDAPTGIVLGPEVRCRVLQPGQTQALGRQEVKGEATDPTTGWTTGCLTERSPHPGPCSALAKLSNGTDRLLMCTVKMSS